jgi:hypothetical protein
MRKMLGKDCLGMTPEEYQKLEELGVKPSQGPDSTTWEPRNYKPFVYQQQWEEKLAELEVL